MLIGKAIARLQRELNDLETVLAYIEERIAANLDRRLRPSPPKRVRDWTASLNHPFPEPEFGLWQQEEQ